MRLVHEVNVYTSTLLYGLLNKFENLVEKGFETILIFHKCQNLEVQWLKTLHLGRKSKLSNSLKLLPVTCYLSPSLHRSLIQQTLLYDVVYIFFI